jgi:protocatechuate 3,4-dioxygenase, alpha subunit
VLHQSPSFKESPSQTAGPYVHIGLTPSLEGISGSSVVDLGTSPLVPGGAPRIIIGGMITDGSGSPVGDAVVEVWQADAEGNYANAWGRAACDAAGRFSFDTVKPGRVRGPDGAPMAPHVSLWIVARGINVGLHTRLYFGDEAQANGTDFVLNRIVDPRRRATLIAARTVVDGQAQYNLPLRLQGEAETVFFDI